MKRKALVTGASSGIGKSITDVLLEEGWEVHGIGRSFYGESHSPDFHPIVLDLLDDRSLQNFLKTFDASRLSLLINNAGVAWYGPHETIRTNEIQAMCRTDLEVPMVITASFLRRLRETHGTIINISSITALSPSPHGAAYGAAKAGLLHFTRTLFEENRKFGMKITALLPDMTDTGLYRHADFTVSDEDGAALLSETIAETVRFILHQPEGTVVTEMALRPQLHRLKRK